MKVELLKIERVNDFVEYCKKHKLEVDESFLNDEDLKDFQPNADNPTCVITDEKGVIVAAASLIVDEYNRRGRKGRFRILHSEIEAFECYDMMLQSILPKVGDIDNIYIFVPIVNKKLMEFVEGLKFAVDRYSFLLVREEAKAPEFGLPEGYTIRAYQAGDEELWCAVRNPSFATLKGSETPMTPELVTKTMAGEGNIEGGAMILFHEGTPVGVVRGEADEYEGAPIMNIGPLAIIPEYQGKGLGRSLLRASLQFAVEKGYSRTILCVNAENERAKALYIQEGFKQVEAVACYKYGIR